MRFATDAQYFFDLLQVGLGLKYGDERYFSEIKKFRYGGADEERPLVGLEQATAFLNDVYSQETFPSPELMKQMAINPFIKALGIDIEGITGIARPKLTFRAPPEGMTLPSGMPYFEYETSAWFMSLVVVTMDRIVEFQSRVTKSV
jgi:hypothetical protein